MKSTDEQLLKRGVAGSGLLNSFRRLNHDGLLRLLESSEACERTAAIKLLMKYKDEETLKSFCTLLKYEKKLYTKLALSEAIEGFGVDAMPYLIPLIGIIGSNQHRGACIVDLNKKSFPLPRDITGRIISRIGPPALPYLETVLSDGRREQKSEAIDSIGHILWNYTCSFDENILIKLMNDSQGDELIIWKIIRCFQCFQSDRIAGILKNIIDYSNNRIFIEEARRSLNRIMNHRK